MDNEYFNQMVLEMTPEDIDNNFFREVAKKYGVVIASDLLLIFESIYPDAKEGQRKISVPLKSTFTARAHRRKIDSFDPLQQTQETS